MLGQIECVLQSKMVQLAGTNKKLYKGSFSHFLSHKVCFIPKYTCFIRLSKTLTKTTVGEFLSFGEYKSNEQFWSENVSWKFELAFWYEILFYELCVSDKYHCHALALELGLILVVVVDKLVSWASCLLDRWTTTWPTPHSFLVLVIFQLGSHVLARGQPQTMNLLPTASYKQIPTYPAYWLRLGLTNFLPQILLISTPK
jgi:hypothetical protein